MRPGGTTDAQTTGSAAAIQPISAAIQRTGFRPSSIFEMPWPINAAMILFPTPTYLFLATIQLIISSTQPWLVAKTGMGALTS